MDQKDHDYNHAKAQSLGDNEEEETKSNISSKPLVREGPKVGRNELCPCGSGKKYKLCCGKI
jgi:preprotein translocase subunit SecA